MHPYLDRLASSFAPPPPGAAPVQGPRGLLVTAGAWGRIVGRGFHQDNVLLRASALTYTTVLSIVPFLAVAFSVLKGFGFHNSNFIRDMLLQVTAGREQVADTILTYINNTNVGTLGGVGMGMLFVTILSVLSNIEKSFNAIWGVDKGRSWLRKFTDYLSVSLVFPVLLVMAVSFTATLKSHTLIQGLLSYSLFSDAWFLAFKLLPYVFMWLALTFLFMFMPNARVRTMPALGGALLGAILWQAAQWVYLTFQVGSAKYNAIYGSFAQVPLFLIWVYLSWTVILIGAEMAHAFQTMNHPPGAARGKDLSPVQRLRMGLAVLLCLGRHMDQGSEPPTVDDIAEETGLPVDDVRHTLLTYRTAGMAAETTSTPDEDGKEKDDGEPRYVLLRSTRTITVKQALDAILFAGEERHRVALADSYTGVDQTLADLDAHMSRAEGGQTLEELLHALKA